MRSKFDMMALQNGSFLEGEGSHYRSVLTPARRGLLTRAHRIAEEAGAFREQSRGLARGLEAECEGKSNDPSRRQASRIVAIATSKRGQNADNLSCLTATQHN
jgi:hypothetical protein